MSLGPFEPHVSAFFSAVENGEMPDVRSPGPENQTATAVSDEVEDFAGAPATRISADTIRRVLMGIPIPAPDQRLWKAVSFANTGIDIREATITGELNLEDLAGAGGSPLPALHFQRCWFSRPIILKRSHLRSLSLKDCRLTELQAAGAVIDGPVVLTDIRRPKEITLTNTEGGKESWGSWVVLTGARIGGYVDCGASSFASVPRGDNPKDAFVQNSKHSRYALDLRATRIGGSVRMRPNVTAIGGVSFNLATVEGSIWCNGAHFTATEDCAFSADYSNIQGSLYLRAYDPPGKDASVRFKAEGQVSLFAAKLAGSLYMEGADLQRSPVKQEDEDGAEFQSVDATNATIGGNCKLSCWQSFAPGDVVPSVPESTYEGAGHPWTLLAT